MKKTFIAFLLAALMVVPMASAVNVETYVDPSEELSESTNLNDPSEAVEDDGIERAVARVEPTGLKLYAIVADANGRTSVYRNHYLYFPPIPGNSFMRSQIGPTKLQEYKDKLSDYGVTPVGWCVNAGYNIQAYRAVRWDLYTWTAAGKSALLGYPASLGTKNFETTSLIKDEKTPYYKIGVSGELIYYPTVSNQARIPVELTAEFISYDPGIQYGTFV